MNQKCYPMSCFSLPLVVERVCYVICFENVCYFLLSSRWSCCRLVLLLNALKYSGGCLRFGPSFTITAALTDFLCVVVHGSVISVRDTTAAVSCVVIVLFVSRIVTNCHESWIPKLRLFFMKYYLIVVDFFSTAQKWA